MAPNHRPGAVPSTTDPGGRRTVLALAMVTVAIVALLAVFVDRDPAFGVTASASPFADEGFNALNARNFVLLGRWSTDGWNLQLVNLPFSLTLAAVFEAAGVGIVQARLATIAMVGASVFALGLGLRRSFSGGPAVIAAAAFGTSALVLFYGRLVYLEDLVTTFLVIALISIGTPRSRNLAWGLVAGAAFALAIATKPSAMFGAGGALAALAVFGSRADRGLRQRVVVATGVVAAAGLAWLALIAIPNLAAIRDDLRIWAPITWPATPAELVRRAGSYLVSNDRAAFYSGPLMLAGAGGAVLAFRHRSELTDGQRSLCIAALGLLVGGFAVLSIASYHPSRYVVPLLPGFAILVAAGGSIAIGRLRPVLGPTRLRAVGGLALLALALPGTAAHVRWLAGAPATLPTIQASMAAIVPRGATVVGPDAPTMAMRAVAVAIVPVPGVSRNSGNLYEAAGARWFLTNPGSRPYLVELPPGIWEARREASCVAWFRATVCLYEVP